MLQGRKKFEKEERKERKRKRKKKTTREGSKDTLAKCHIRVMLGSKFEHPKTNKPVTRHTVRSEHWLDVG